jgi:hypothetical protein
MNKDQGEQKGMHDRKEDKNRQGMPGGQQDDKGRRPGQDDREKKDQFGRQPQQTPQGGQRGEEGRRKEDHQTENQGQERKGGDREGSDRR